MPKQKPLKLPDEKAFVPKRKPVEQALRESEMRFRAIFEQAAVGVAVVDSRSGRFKQVNRRYCEITGLTAEAMIATDFAAITHPDDLETDLSNMRRLRLGEINDFSIEKRYIRPDGSLRWVNLFVSRLWDTGAAPSDHIAIVEDITQRKRMEAALRQSESQLSRILNNVSDVIFAIAVKPEGGFRFASVNHRFLELTGLKEDQVVGSRVREILPESSHALVFQKYQEAVETRQPVHWEEVFDHPGGRTVGHVTIVPVFDEHGRCAQLVGMVHDITERKEAERALQESERKYRELVECANSIILRWTHDGRVSFLNEFGQRFFGYSVDEIIGRHVIGTIVPTTDTRGRDLRQLMDEICADPIAFEQNVNENMRRNGERVWISWTNRIVKDAHGQVAEILSIGTDITERKRAQEAIAQMNVQLEKRVAERTEELAVARDRAEAADRLKSVFLATMSHELRTPLNSIIGFTGIILQELPGPLNAEQHKQLEMVRDSARHLLSLINDVLDISKIEAGQLQVDCEPFDLRTSIAKIAGIVKPFAEKKGLSLRVGLSPELGWIVGDSRRVEQVVLNLLSNAIKFTERGAVTLTAEATPDSRDPRHSGVRISVADTGIGVKAEDLPALFQPFRQIETGLTRHYDGTGLGLAICRRLAALMGGNVSATSEWGKGSIFTFTLPGKGRP